MKDINFKEIENHIDNYMFNILDEEIPRNKYIYHCNLAFIDILIDDKILFTVFEKDYLFSLNYNTFIAHKKLKEEITFDYEFDNKVYIYAREMIIKGMQYSFLCNVFPLLYSGKARMVSDESEIISFDIDEIPKRNYKFINDYTIKKILSYTLQIANGKLEDLEDGEIAIKLYGIYSNFWSENMLYDDFEPYSRLDWGGIDGFFTIAAMRRFNEIYKNNFDIAKISPAKMMIVLSESGVKRLREYAPNCNDHLYEMVLEDNIYKPLGRELFPKLSIADAPLNRTTDGFIFANPLVLLFNGSYETRYLNYLRKCDNPRYMRTKDKIKERVIPLIEEMIKYKFPKAKVISNFNVDIPNRKKQRRECDILIVEDTGVALYVEVKHFYYPISSSETKILDSELSLALTKMPEQLSAISNSWNALQELYGFSVDLRELNGVIASHHYTGFDIKIDENTPIIEFSTLYETIAKANSIREIYVECRELDLIYPKINFIKNDIEFEFAGFKFKTTLECLDPSFEVQLIQAYKKQVANAIEIGKHKNYNTVSELARAYIKKME